MRKGIFIAFEGIDGSGKSTQIQLLAEKIKEKGLRCYQTCEPSGGPVGSLTRQILSGRMKADPRVIAAMFAADRLDHLLNEKDGIVKKIEDGICVITDRYYFSSYAYHSVDVPMDWVIKLNEESAKVLRPDLNVYIDIDVDTAMERINKNRFHTELFEKKSYLEKVRENYIIAFSNISGERFLSIPGNQPPEKIAELIWTEIEFMIEEREKQEKELIKENNK